MNVDVLAQFFHLLAGTCLLISAYQIELIEGKSNKRGHKLRDLCRSIELNVSINKD